MDLRKTQAISITESNIKKHIDAFNEVNLILKEEKTALTKIRFANHDDEIDLHPDYINDKMVEAFINSYKENIRKGIKAEIEQLKNVLNSPG